MIKATHALLLVSGVLGNNNSDKESGDMTNDAKNALLAIFEKVAYVNENGQTYYDALEAALFPPADLESITAVFNQGSATIYTTDTLDDLRQYLIVTATYSDSTTEVVTAYTLSGTLAVGTSTITATYGGKTDTFTVTVSQYVPAGYVTDGLVFFLDGNSVESNSEWTDIIGGKTFALTNCTRTNKGVVFDGTAYGEHSGAITNDFANETIEIVLNGRSTITASTVLSQPYMNDSVGISMRFGLEVAYTPRFAIGLDATQRAYYYKQIIQDKNRISANSDRVVVNEEAATSTHTTSYAKNQTGITYVGAGRFTLEGAVGGFYVGTIHAIRIYNRKLTEAEIKANQQTDVTYYGL